MSLSHEHASEQAVLFSGEFNLDLPAVVNVVGGGGKTGLILRLLDEFAESMPAIYTTTTRIHPPDPTPGLVIISADNAFYLKLIAEALGSQSWERGRKFVLTRLAVSPGLLQGVEPDFARSLDKGIFRIVLNEADGARSMSIKMPRENEPVLMEEAEYLVPVIGLDCLDRPLGPKTLFRWDVARRRLKLKAGQPLTSELAASILLHPEGVCRDWRPGMKIVPFINKVDTEELDARARALALELLGNQDFQVERVVWGSVIERRAASLSAPRQ